MVTQDEELKWAYLLDPCFELTNSAGKPLTDGYIEVYIAGTRNKYYCASDFAGTLHPFQIPLDSLGSNIVLANPDNAYDVYVYNRYGNLIMSRYNVTPADGGAVISNTERINELEETLVSAVTGLQGQIDDINVTLENKKDKQEPYSVTLTPTQTVSAIIQNENGEMEVIYQEIDLPDDVPNVDIVSPASTLNITTHIDEETNTKTFSIDISDLGHLEYGQYMATEDVITGANMYRIKGNLNTTLDGKIKLHKGNSYHITVRGAYVCTDINNSVNTLDYIEYSTFTPFHVDVDNTVTDPQNFEISYDIFKLSNDTDYYIAFAASAGKVSNLTVEIHSLSNLSVIDGGNYTAGWGIDITNNVISVDPSILEDYVTEEEVIQIVSGISGIIPADVATHTEVYEATVTAVQTATALIPELPDEEEVEFEEINLDDYALASAIPDVSNYTTHSEVNNAIVTAINYVTGVIPDAQVQSDWNQNDDTQPDYIKNKPDLSIYATHTEVYDSSVTAVQMVTGLIPDAQVQSDWTETNTTDPAYIKHKPNQTELVAGQNIGIFDNGSTLTIAASGTDLTGYATETEVNSAIVTAINYVTGIIPDAQVQSNWEETDTSDPSYIQNKPQEYDVVAGDNIGISVEGNTVTISASGISAEEVIEIVSGVTSLTEYGQFYATAVSGAAVMARTKGTIDVTNDGKIKLKQGSSYHVTVRGRYNQTTPNNVYSNISYIEYITNNNININVDKSITESQFFEISYDLYKLNSDSNYYVFFSGLEGTVNDLFIEIHALGGIGGNGGSVTGSAEYDAGWGIQILNNVISVNPSIIPDDINLVAGTNIGIIVSGNDLVIAASGSDLSDYATLEQLQDSVELVTGLIPTVQLNSSNMVTAINNYPIYSEGGTGTTYTAGDGIDITNNIISVDNTVALKSDIPDVTDYATHAEVNNVSGAIVDLISELPEDLNLVAGDNITIEVSGVSAIISAQDSGTTYSAGNGIDITNDVISIDNTVALKTDIPVVTGFATIEQVSAVSAAIPELPSEEEVEFEEIDLSDYALASAIPSLSSLNTAGITDIQLVNSLPVSPVSSVLYLIPEV